MIGKAELPQLPERGNHAVAQELREGHPALLSPFTVNCVSRTGPSLVPGCLARSRGAAAAGLDFPTFGEGNCRDPSHECVERFIGFAHVIRTSQTAET